MSGAVARPVFRLFQLISYPQLRASWGRTLLVIGGIATGVTLIVSMNVINTSVLENFRRTIDLLAGPADLEITLGVGEVGFPESTLEAVRADPDVAAAVPLVRGTISLADDPADTIELFGADLTAERDLDRYHVTIASDRREASMTVLEPHSVLLTTVFAQAHGVRVGDQVALSTPHGVSSFAVRGLVTTDGLAAALNGRMAIMDLPAAQLLLAKEERLDQIDVVLRRGADVAEAERRLGRALASSLTVARPAQRGAQYEKILESFQAMLTGLSTLCLIAGVFIVYNTTSTGAVQRAFVIAGLRLIGADTRQLFRLMMMEALALGALGTLIGTAIGIVQARLLSRMVADSMGIIFQLRFPVPILALDVTQLLAIGTVGVAAALFASYFAARRVTALEPLEIIRPDSRARTPVLHVRRLVLWWALLVMISAAALVAEQSFKSIVWGNVGSTLWNASVIVIAIPVVSWLAKILSRVLPRWFGPEGRVAAESLFRMPWRTGVTVAAIALVLTVAITVSSLVVSSRISIGGYVEGFLSGDLVVSAVATEGGWLETPLPESAADEIRGLAGVQRVETGRVVPGQIYRGQRIGILALSDGMFEPSRYPAGWFREGNADAAAVALRAGRGVTISTGLADRFGLHAGQVIALDTPSGGAAFPIVGVVPDYISDRGSVIMSRGVFVEHWRDRSVSRINVFVASGAEVSGIRRAILDRLGDRYRLKALSLREVRAYHEAYVDRAFAFTDAIQLLIVIVTVAGIFDLLLSAIVERRHELALWRLIGADERAVRRSVVIESATIGVLGAVLGIAVGFVTAWIWIGINFRYLLGYYLEYHLALGSTAWYITLVMLMTMLAGYGAANRATRQSILESIQVE